MEHIEIADREPQGSGVTFISYEEITKQIISVTCMLPRITLHLQDVDVEVTYDTVRDLTNYDLYLTENNELPFTVSVA